MSQTRRIVARPDPVVEALAKRMWNAYIAGMPKDERDGYTRWAGLGVRDPDTQRGFRAVARMALRWRNAALPPVTR